MRVAATWLRSVEPPQALAVRYTSIGRICLPRLLTMYRVMWSRSGTEVRMASLKCPWNSRISRSTG